ncbi:MAG TPA: response regulator [Methylophilaceae bacterium]|nr:response regulator [Methylophilaceae bacterium]
METENLSLNPNKRLRTTILTVDDDPGILLLLGLRLKAAGYEVVTAQSGEEALAQIALSRPDLVISDLRMPGMDGMALFEHIHSTDPDLPFIMITADGSPLDASDAMARGIFCFMTKPFDSKQLLQQVAAALQQETQVLINTGTHR